MKLTTIPERLVQFVHLLREQGFSIGISETGELLNCLGHSNWIDQRWSYTMMRALACNNRDDWYRFEQLFHAFWFQSGDPASAQEIKPDTLNPAKPGISGIAGSTGQDLGQPGGLTGLEGTGAGNQKTISRADFRFLNDHKAMQQVEELAERLASRIKQRRERRFRIRQKGEAIAFRQTLRRNLSCGGAPIRLLYKSRQSSPVPIVILHDVSHSMAWNNPLLFRFVRGIIRTFKNSEAFAFHTRLFRVTEHYRHRCLERTRLSLEQDNHLWLGGTCIAESMEHFNNLYAKRHVSSNSVVVIISDGYDTNDPEQLSEQLALLAARSRKIVWLNPMIGREGYQLDKPHMRQIKPYIDAFASANNLDSLAAALDYIATDKTGNTLVLH